MKDIMILFALVVLYYVFSICYFISQMGYKNRKDRWYDWILIAPVGTIILVLWLPLRWKEVHDGDTTWKCIFGNHKYEWRKIENDKVWFRCPLCGHQEIIDKEKVE